MTSNYEVIPFIYEFNEAITSILGNIQNNFVVALFWVALGKVFAEKSIKIERNMAYIGVLISVILLYMEYGLYIQWFGSSGHSDCYFMLLPLCLFGFSLLVHHNKVKVKHAYFLRKSSTLIYVMHYGVIICLGKFNPYFGNHVSTIKFTLTLFIVLFSSVIIIKILNIHKVTLLKYLC